MNTTQNISDPPTAPRRLSDVVFERKYTRGDRRSDGFIFYSYQLCRGKVKESWLSPEAFERKQKNRTPPKVWAWSRDDVAGPPRKRGERDGNGKVFVGYGGSRNGPRELWVTEASYAKKLARKKAQRPEAYTRSVGRILESKYGIGKEQYDQMYHAQDGCCAICGTHRSGVRYSLAVDHCHVTGSVRGLLCTRCNLALGGLSDDSAVLARAEEYLRKPETGRLVGVPGGILAEMRTTDPKRWEARAPSLQARYGISPDQFDALYAHQGGACAICTSELSGVSRAVHVDHCHETNRVRGILCRGCNVAIGLFRDDPRLVARARMYLDCQKGGV
jgi:hypothetical protein